LKQTVVQRSRSLVASSTVRQPDHLLLLDLDSNLDLPEDQSLAALRGQLQRDGGRYGLGILTGRSLAMARQRYDELHLPTPQVWISRAGTEIHFGEALMADRAWEQHISADWSREAVQDAMEDLQDHLTLQVDEQQGPWKVSYLLRQPDPAVLNLVRQRLRRQGVQARPQLRCHWFLDVLPRLASRSEAIRHLSLCWDLPLEKVLVMASQQGDAELLGGLPATVVPADHDPCLERQPQQKQVLFSGRSSLSAVLDGLNHFRFPSSR
jgi:sucrose-phosphate synthase